jgi:CubicO group peptidase (beta-lactamase class C family)
LKFFVLLITLTPGLLLAAPDEELLGRSQGYPVCPMSQYGTQHCLVGQFSNFDKIVPARTVAKGQGVYELKRAPQAEAGLRYRLREGGEGNIEKFLETNRNTGLLVLKGDTILAEHYQYDRTPAHRFQSMSMAKTVLAMLMGVAVKDGLIASIDDPASKYVADLKGQPYGETSLRHLLTMSSGVAFREDYDGKDDVQVLGRKTFGQQGPGGAETVATFRTRAAPAGTKFYYASAETQVLGLVLRAAVGKPLAEYLSEKIWQPMGAEADATWLIDAGGYELGYAGINATLRDWGRFGLLLAHDGALNGRQIIPAEWVKAATTAEAAHLKVGVASKFNGYGYQTWLIHPDKRMFALLGVRGQGVFVDPQTRTVIVHTAVHAESRGTTSRYDQFSLFFGTAARAAALSSN